MKIFKDRQSAGKLLAERLKQYTHGRGIIVLGIPRGGVVVACEIAKQLNLPLDIVITRKIGAPMQKELALGALDPDGEVTWETDLLEDLRVKIYDLREEVKRQIEEIKRRDKLYRGNKKPLNIEGRTIILADDGVATGSTVLSAVRHLKRHQTKQVILAVPVASRESLEKIIKEVDEVEVLYVPPILGAVGQFYQNFQEVSDQEVIQLLNNE